MGIADVASLVSTIESVIQEGGDIGSYTSLRPYPRERYFANHLLLSATDHLNSIFSTTSRPLVWARSNGLEVINELDWVKERIMRQAGSRKEVERSAGVWGGVASVLDGVQSGFGVAKGVAGLAAQRFKFGR
jgi:ubiquinone biosynthesis monooxygenase Coq6